MTVLHLRVTITLSTTAQPSTQSLTVILRYAPDTRAIFCPFQEHIYVLWAFLLHNRTISTFQILRSLSHHLCIPCIYHVYIPGKYIVDSRTCMTPAWTRDSVIGPAHRYWVISDRRVMVGARKGETALSVPPSLALHCYVCPLTVPAATVTCHPVLPQILWELLLGLCFIWSKPYIFRGN